VKKVFLKSSGCALFGAGDAGCDLEADAMKDPLRTGAEVESVPEPELDVIEVDTQLSACIGTDEEAALLHGLNRLQQWLPMGTPREFVVYLRR